MMEALMKSLFITILTLMMIAVATVQGDYHIGWVLRNYSANPDNYLATNGTCCEENCSPCSPVLRLCFRESGQSHEDTDTCTFGLYLRNSPSVFVQLATGTSRIPGLFTGSFQVYIRVAHDGSVSRMFDPNDPLIDNIFFEFTGVQATTGPAVIIEETGDFNRSTIDLLVNVVCAQGYNGADCNTFCEEINGTLTCREDDIIVPTTPSVVTTDDIDLTMTSSQTSSSPETVSVGRLTTERSDNTLAIAVGVGVGGAIFLLLVVGGIILTILLVIKIRQRAQKTAFYTIKRAETSPSTNGDKYARGRGDDDDDTQGNNHPTNVEDLYATVNKKSKAPPLPPAYVPDAREYQNLKSDQGHQGVVYANTSASHDQTQKSIHLRYADDTDSTPTSHIINQDAASDGNESASSSELRQE